MAKRYYGLDILRLVSMVAIVTFHFNYVLLYTRDFSHRHDSGIWNFLQAFSHPLFFSGFTIVILTCFLHGMKAKTANSRMKLYSFLTLGWIFFCAAIASETPFFLVWDIYPFLLTGLLIVLAAETLGRKWLRGLGVLGFFILFIPFWKFDFFNDSPLWLQQILVGNCEKDLADWPLLPWVGLIWCSYAGGHELKDRSFQDRLVPFSKKEVLFWSFLLTGSLFNFGRFGWQVPQGPGFACFIYRLSPVDFFSHIIWPIFLLRVSFIPALQSLLAGFPPVRWLGALSISTHFWLFYIFHYLLIVIIDENLGHSLRALPPASGLVLLLLLPLTEVLTQSGIFVFKKLNPS